MGPSSSDTHPAPGTRKRVFRDHLLESKTFRYLGLLLAVAALAYFLFGLWFPRTSSADAGGAAARERFNAAKIEQASQLQAALGHEVSIETAGALNTNEDTAPWQNATIYLRQLSLEIRDSATSVPGFLEAAAELRTVQLRHDTHIQGAQWRLTRRGSTLVFEHNMATGIYLPAERNYKAALIDLYRL